MLDAGLKTSPPESPETDEKPLREQVKEALDARDTETLAGLLSPLPPSSALRQLLLLEAGERDILLSLVPVDLAAELVAEAPLEAVGELVSHMATERAAEVMDTLNSDLQADIVGELDTDRKDAILARLHPDDAADVRRLAEYPDDTAGGLMVADAFTFAAAAKVGAVLRGITSEDADFERYRGQHPYVVDDEDRPVGVVSLRNLPWRSEQLDLHLRSSSKSISSRQVSCWSYELMSAISFDL